MVFNSNDLIITESQKHKEQQSGFLNTEIKYLDAELSQRQSGTHVQPDKSAMIMVLHPGSEDWMNYTKWLREQWLVIELPSREQTEKILSGITPDLLFTDCRIPGAEKLLENNRPGSRKSGNQLIPVLFTGHHSSTSKSDREYLSNPFSKEQLFKKVKYLLNNGSQSYIYTNSICSS